MLRERVVLNFILVFCAAKGLRAAGQTWQEQMERLAERFESETAQLKLQIGALQKEVEVGKNRVSSLESILNATYLDLSTSNTTEESKCEKACAPQIADLKHKLQTISADYKNLTAIAYKDNTQDVESQPLVLVLLEAFHKEKTKNRIQIDAMLEQLKELQKDRVEKNKVFEQLQQSQVDGVGQTTTVPSTTARTVPDVDVVLIIDVSSTATSQEFDKMLTFVKQYINKFDIDSGSARIGIIVISERITIKNIIFHLNSYSTKAEIITAIDSKLIYIPGLQNTANALKMMRRQMFRSRRGDRPDARNFAVLVEYGISSVSQRRTIPEAKAAHDKGILLYSIGIGLTDSHELEEIASNPVYHHSFYFQDFDELLTSGANIADSFYNELLSHVDVAVR